MPFGFSRMSIRANKFERYEDYWCVRECRRRSGQLVVEDQGGRPQIAWKEARKKKKIRANKRYSVDKY